MNNLEAILSCENDACLQTDWTVDCVWRFGGSLRLSDWNSCNRSNFWLVEPVLGRSPPGLWWRMMLAAKLLMENYFLNYHSLQSTMVSSRLFQFCEAFSCLWLFIMISIYTVSVSDGLWRRLNGCSTFYHFIGMDCGGFCNHTLSLISDVFLMNAPNVWMLMYNWSWFSLQKVDTQGITTTAPALLSGKPQHGRQHKDGTSLTAVGLEVLMAFLFKIGWNIYR